MQGVVTVQCPMPDCTNELTPHCKPGTAAASAFCRWQHCSKCLITIDIRKHRAFGDKGSVVLPDLPF